MIADLHEKKKRSGQGSEETRTAKGERRAVVWQEKADIWDI